MEPVRWQKSSYCGQGESCIHVAAGHGAPVRLTESADPQGTVLRAAPAAWAALVGALKDGRGRD
ncbi:DUF397 domain-containing protein [Streptomyces nitrosporeus]|uniref:DUF397 domain-containing protein n=1 Tax=Streptomyces nitrosporeus TaxID=28894 RepID=UPI00399FA2C5